MNSDTSSEANIKYDGDENKPKVTTDTDFYMNLLANPDKIKPEAQPSLNPIPDDSTSKISDTESSSSSSSSDSSKKSSKKSSKSEKQTYGHMDTPKWSYPETKTNFKQTENFEVKVQEKPLSEKEIKLKKIEYLKKLSDLKSQGFELTQEFNFNSSLSDMECEYEVLKRYVDEKNGVKLYKNLLINGVALIEFFNDKYNPFEFHLEGWSEHMSVEVDSFEDVLRELYEKYRGNGRNIPPELKLVGLVFASGAAFHYSKSTLGKAVGLNRPGSLSNFMPKPEQSRFMTPQEANLRKMQQQSQTPQPQQPNYRAPPMRTPVTYPAGTTPVPQQSFQTPPTQQVQIPDNVSNILQRIKANNQQTSSNRVVSETTINSSEMNTSERKRRGRKPKSVIHINT